MKVPHIHLTWQRPRFERRLGNGRVFRLAQIVAFDQAFHQEAPGGEMMDAGMVAHEREAVKADSLVVAAITAGTDVVPSQCADTSTNSRSPDATGGNTTDCCTTERADGSAVAGVRSVGAGDKGNAREQNGDVECFHELNLIVHASPSPWGETRLQKQTKIPRRGRRGIEGESRVCVVALFCAHHQHPAVLLHLLFIAQGKHGEHFAITMGAERSGRDAEDLGEHIIDALGTGG